MDLLWKSCKMQGENDRHKQIRGLGLSHTIRKYGFGYPENHLINWRELIFMDSAIADSFPYPSALISNLIARPQIRQRIMTLFQEIDHIVSRIQMEENDEVKGLLLHWLAMRLIRQYHHDVISYLIVSKYEYRKQQEHRNWRPRIPPENEQNENQNNGDIRKRSRAQSDDLSEIISDIEVN